MKPGRVSLVGAGPGDPELLTLRAVRRLAEADLVLYDALVDRRLLELAPRARRFQVGKRAGRPSIRQETIHALILRAARRGQQVVRLKGGDPFLFGRGGEELAAMARAGVACEYVPGVSSALAAPGLAGVPVTHRGVARAVLVVTAVPEEPWRALLAHVAPEGLTVVMLMALERRRAIAHHLLGLGWSPDWPVAVVVAASTPREHVATLTLADLAHHDLPAACAGEAGLLVIGRVVDVREELAGLGERELLREHGT
ncbi:MAG: uroporphyrinogen-III C-methyltransferase [Myxococcales bacterium]|nr:uroporphyrinogen-III C-methyltransferase [Myxococcales bacterium]